MKLSVRIKLSTMMFLQFFIWGVWFVTMGTYLGPMVIDGVNVFQPTDIGRAYSTFAWGAIISPFFVGMVADRFFSAERVLGVCHIMGAVMIYFASTITDPGLFFWVLLGYTLCYLPTIALANSVAMEQMTVPETEFPPIRVLGTIGWIVAGLIVGFMKLEAEATPMIIASGVSLFLGVYSFILPHTPPKARGKKISVADVLGLEALQMMKDRSFAVFVVSSLLICIPLAFYYNFTNLFLNNMEIENAASKMTMGQASEVFFMLVMPLCFRHLGVKMMLLIGMLAWTLRYTLFAWGNSESLVLMYYTGILLHGICYDFFFVAGYIYTDSKAPSHLRASAQGFITLVTLGLGMLIGSYFSGYWVGEQTLYDPKNVDAITGYDWKNVWMLPAIMALFVAIGFALLFKNGATSEQAIGDLAEEGAS
jgi:nucleoside transporter